jgi:Lhr-like helicase
LGKVDHSLIPEVVPEPTYRKIGNEYIELQRHKAIFDNDGIDIASQKKTYQVVQHREVIKRLQENPSFNEKYYIENATIYKSGCILMIEVKPIQEERVELVPGDFLTKSVRIYNSYDSSKALVVESFGMRLICSNGAVAPGGVDRFHKAHTHQNVNLDSVPDAIEKAMKTWEVSSNTLRKAYTKIVDVEDTLKLLKNFQEKYKKIVIQNLRRMDTLYNLWNALTNCITFEVDVSTSTLVNYQNMVNKIFNVLNDPKEDTVVDGSVDIPETEKTGTEKTETKSDSDQDQLGE